MKRLIALLIFVAVVFGCIALLRSGNYGSRLLSELMGREDALLPLVLIAALIDSINPCALSVLFITVAFLFSLGRSRREIIGIGSVYIAGIFLVYVLIGLGVLRALQLFSTPHFMSKFGASALLIFGILGLLGHFFPSFPVKLKIPQISHGRMAGLIQKGSIPAALGLGFLVGLFEFPCTGGPYLMVLGLLHDQGTYLKGLLYLILYNLVFVLPLVIILIAASDRMVLGKLEEWKKQNLGSVKLWTGIAMIVLALLILLL